MTSPANQQNPIPATNTSASTAASYASAAGAPKKSAQAPVVAPGSHPPVVVGSSAPSAQNAKAASSPSPVNGKSAVTPAVPAVARGSSNLNGSAPDHSRKSSVTMAANGPSGYVANGGSLAGAKSAIQFGYDSPAMAHSTPQTGHSAPIPIPGGNQRVPSPAHSPSPIPQPSASGGRPPSSLQQPTAQMTFGSLGSDGERHMRQGSVPSNPNALGSQPNTHFRRESSHSVQSDNPGAPNRGNFPPQGGRGRGNFNPQATHFNNQMGYPPNNQFRNGPGQGRGMPPAFQPQPRNMPYPNSPQPARSPALVPSMPGTPNMPPATMQPNMTMQTPPQYHYPPPMAPQHQQNFGYPPQQMDQYGRPMTVPYGYGNIPYMAPPQANSPGYNQQFVPPPYHQQSHSMSRSPSQAERPASTTQPTQPVIVSSNPQVPNAQPKPSSSSFVKPRKSAAIQIKNAAGEVVDTSTFKQPASPVPSIHQTKTPPVTSTPTPPNKPSTPSHARSDSLATPKTAKEIQDELKAKIKQATQAALEDSKAKEEEKKKEEEKPEEKPEVKPEEKPEEKPEVKPEVEVKVEEKKEEPVEVKAEPEPKPTEETTPPTSDKPEAAKVEEPKQVEEPKKAEEKPAEPANNADPEEDEIERMIREMEEADARREKEEEEHQKKREAEKAAAKALEAKSQKISPEEADRKLREQEREMERLEEERERKREEAESSGKTLSVAEALAKLRGGEKKEESSNVDSVADKLAGMNIGGDKAASSAEPAKEKRVPKPAALNLAPINTKPVEPPQPSAALQSLKSARFLQIMDQEIYPAGIKSPNPALNAAVAKKGKTFKYDAAFLLQFQKVFTEQPSLQFHQQIKSLIGDGDGGRSASRGQTPNSARQGSRGGAGGFPGGPFGGPPGRTLPPGTTSADRMAIANGALPRPQVNPMASFQRPGASFPSSASMSRTSSQNMRNMPNSPRQSSRNTRGSRRNDLVAKEAQAAKTMPLTAGQEVKPITVSASGWKASSLSAKAVQPVQPGQGYLDPELVQRKVKAALNKMTPEKFDRISDQILVIASQSKDESDGRTLRQVIQLTFEKATDEAHWASMYAKFCKRMLETMSADIRDERIKDKNGQVVSGGNLFRKYLLNRCQEEFERGWTSNLPEPKEADESDPKAGEAAMLSDEYYQAAAAKRRGLGLVQFIGELFKLGMLTERIMHECVRKLVDYKGIPDEAEIESLCKLLRTIGANLDDNEKGRPMMDVYFQRIQATIDLPELNSRMKFMLMDVVDLRRAHWVSKEANKGPKTLEEVRAEAEAAQAAKAQEAAKTNQRGGGGRPPVGRGDARNFSGNYTQQTSNQVGMDDLRRLKGSINRTSSAHVTLGPTSMFASRSNSGRRLGPGGSLGRPGDDSNSSSRTGTPGPSHSNAFSLLATMDTDHPGSPPSAGPSPLMSKAVPASDKKDGE